MPEWPVKVRTHSPESTFHILIVWSSDPLAINSGCCGSKSNATKSNFVFVNRSYLSSLAPTTLIKLPFFQFQSLIVPSLEPLASSSCEICFNATIILLCPFNVRMRSPVFKSHMRIELSSEPLAKVRSSNRANDRTGDSDLSIKDRSLILLSLSILQILIVPSSEALANSLLETTSSAVT